MKYFILFLTILNVLASPEKGLEVARIVEKASSGFVGESSTMTLDLISADGAVITRKMQGFSKEGKTTDKSLMIFTHPADVNGTKLLTWSHDNKDDEQWLYLTSLRRAKKISSKSKGSSFMGSEFSFEDLSGQAVEKYNYNLISETKFNGKSIWKLERFAKSKSSYNKVVLYIDKESKLSLKSEYYNKRNELKKIATISDIKAYTVSGKKIYRANKILMKNSINNKSSIFKWSNRTLGTSIPDSRFTKRALRK